MRGRKEKRPLKSSVREGILFVERLLAVLLAVSIALIFMNSFFHIQASYGTTYHYVISPLEQDRSFEEKEIFHSLLQGNMEQITRYAVICHQLETDGEYDENKIINITRYANRASGVLGEEVTADYYLDDLITWGNYGFTYNTVVGTWEELSSLFKDNDTSYVNGGKSFLKEYEGSMEENANALALENEQSNQYAMEILIPRYETIDGRDLMECASSIEEYETLKDNLITSANNLFNNYTEYTRLKENYGSGKTNISYFFQIPDGEGMKYYTNSSLPLQGKTVDDITAMIKEEGGRFIFFNPDKVQINTNTDISAKQMRSMLKEYEYTFTDNTRVWFWVDKEYGAKDSLQIVKQEIEDFKPYFRALSIVSLSAFGGILLVLIFLSGKEGRAYDGEGKLQYITYRTDAFPMEIWLLLAAMAEAVILLVMAMLFPAYQGGNLPYTLMPVLVGILTFLGNEIALRCYFSLVRRWKAGKLWSSTLLYLLGKEGKSFVIRTYHNGGVVSRTWIPYLIFLMANLILVLLGIGGVLGAFLIDMLIGVYLYREKRQLEEIVEGIEIIKNGKAQHRIDTTGLHGDNLRLASSVNSIGLGIRQAVETSMKDEKLKTDLITNVSHDIKTPLTSIITYVDLLKRENISEERILSYIDVLDNKSQRLKQLIDDLVEASKISSGNIELHIETINFIELVRQAIGEFDEKLADKQLQIVFKAPQEPMYIESDSSQLWRVMENLLTNACKYSLEGTRIYVEMDEVRKGNEIYSSFLIKNISATYLEVSAKDLTERFMRGDQSRKTEGSGLGLSIAKSLVEALGGEFKIEVDGDLFKASICFKAAYESIR